jgi:hypothetical protein
MARCTALAEFIIVPANTKQFTVHATSTSYTIVFTAAIINISYLKFYDNPLSHTKPLNIKEKGLLLFQQNELSLQFTPLASTFLTSACMHA